MGQGIYSFFKTVIFRPLVKGPFRGTVTGLENIPAGPAVLASNHLGAFDPVIISALSKRPITYVAKAELFRGRSLGRRIVAWLLRNINTVPVERTGGRNTREALAPVLDVLAAGGLVGFFPEGTRSPDGYLHKGKTGVARIVLAADVPVVPMAFFSSETVRRIGIPWVRRPRVVIGQPMTFSQYCDGHDDQEVLRYVTDEIMNAIMALSQQQYLDIYGSSIKSGAMSEAAALKQLQPRPGGGEPPALPSS